MRDGPLRRAIKWVFRQVARAELALARWRRPPRYVLRGSCNGCGKCCESPALQLSRVGFHVSAFRRLTVWWQRVVNGFELLETDARLRLLIFRCTHYEPATRTCDSYESRPLLCRDYPVNQAHEAVPHLFPECSYTVVDRQARALTAALKASGLTGEKLAEVRRKLFLIDPDDHAP